MPKAARGPGTVGQRLLCGKAQVRFRGRPWWAEGGWKGLDDAKCVRSPAGTGTRGQSPVLSSPAADLV